MTNLTLCITGGIAAYKMPNVVRLLKKDEFKVRVVMSENSKQFVTPLVLSTLSGQPVLDNQFDWTLPHINLQKETDLFVLCPLTANTIGKLAHGLADDLLTATILATRKPVLLIPAMNTGMWENQLVQANLQKLLSLPNFYILNPANGELACGDSGCGRMPDLNSIVLEIKKRTTPQDLQGQKVLITAGATREYLDPVRFLSNASSGLMGKCLAEEAYCRGAEVKVVCGNMTVDFASQIKTASAQSAEEMLKLVQHDFAWCDLFISTAAVADYKPAQFQKQKIKKQAESLTLELALNPDILKTVAQNKGQKTVIGFALESSNLIENAQRKLKAKNLDFIVANEVAAIGAEQSKVVVLGRAGQVVELVGDKRDVSEKFWGNITQN